MNIEERSKSKTDIYLEELRSESQGSIIVTYPNAKLDDVIVKDEIKNIIKERLIRLIRPQNSTGPRIPNNNILLHGPSGVGKSLLIRAPVSECKGVPLIWVYLRLLTRHYSQEKCIIPKLFELCGMFTKCVIVLDDLNHISTSTEYDISKTIVEQIRDELIAKLLDTRMKDALDTFIIAVTNKPWEVDKSLIKCFDDRLYLPLPTATERSTLLQMFLRVKRHGLRTNDFIEFGEKSELFTGHDILTISRDILAEPSRRVQHSSYFKQVSKWCKESNNFRLMWTPCVADDKNSVLKSWTDIDSDEILEPELTFDIALEVIDRSQPTVSMDEVRKHVGFAHEYEGQ